MTDTNQEKNNGIPIDQHWIMNQNEHKFIIFI
jgi:hypothetical protein